MMLRRVVLEPGVSYDIIVADGILTMLFAVNY